MSEASVEYRGQCDAWWDAHGCQLIDWPKGVTGGLPQHIFMRCVMEAGHDPLPGSLTGHNFGGLGPYTPGMPGWRAQQRALGAPDVIAKDEDWQKEVWSHMGKVAQDIAIGAMAEVLRIPVPPCVKWEGHDYPNGITCRNCWTYWNDQRSALFAADPSAWTPPND